MIAHRTSAIIAVLALLASAVAVAQTPPPASTDPGNTSATSPNPQDMTNTPASEGPSSSSVTQDPKLDRCVSDENAKNTGLSENQLKQKCMLKIAGD
jgi:hypothetical protein